LPHLADSLRQRGEPPERVSHFLTQCVFSLFAEDVGLLPSRMFERLLANKQATPERLAQGLTQLFETMRSGGLYGVDDIPWFNGGLFKTVAVPALTTADLQPLRDAAALNWSAIDPSIFGTLFERGLDPSKRSQLGAHYTDPATIERIIGPVIRQPLIEKWELAALDIQALQAKSTKKNDKHHRAASARFIGWLQELAAYRALDPACGSGNFLYLALKCLKDIEHHSHLQAADLGLDRQTDLVTGPHNVLGIELNEYAAELARVTVWIGELQWRIDHGYEFKTNPVLDTLDHIECRDALLAWQGDNATEAEWPAADVVVGNPPFLGDKKMRAELGDPYTTTLRATYEGRVPGGADLVCYWFDKARQHMANGSLATRRAGQHQLHSRRCQPQGAGCHLPSKRAFLRPGATSRG
jgi:type II restriction/modification system DNA methylase subunit YeeA